MRSPTRMRAITLAVLSAALLPTVPVAARTEAAPSAPVNRSSELGGAAMSAALGSDGTYHGAAGVTGTVDTSAWTLTNDLSRGEAPRFARRNAATPPSATGRWSALGSNGFGDVPSISTC